MTLSYVGSAIINGVDTFVYRDDCGKWYVKCNGITTQKKLNATEIVRYLLNVKNGS